MVTWCWSADTLFWQLSISYNMDVQYQRCSYGNGATLVFQGMGLGVRTYGGTYRQSRDNQATGDRWLTKFSKVWGSTRAPSARRSSANTGEFVNKNCEVFSLVPNHRQIQSCQSGKRPGSETGSPLLVQCVMRKRTGTGAPSALPVRLMTAKNLLSTNRKFSFFCFEPPVAYF